MQYLIEVSNLTKTYKSSKVTALDGLSLKIGKGQVFGLLGPNGAGKSTLIKCINNLIKPDSGLIKIFGKSISETKNLIGYMPEQANMYEFLTGRDFIQTIACLRNIKKIEINQRIEELSDVLELPNLDILVSSYSKGNKEKILFLSTVIHSPKLLILDEPFTGFDPKVIYKAKKYIKDYALRGNTVILCTHILEMAAQLCDEVAIIKSGKIKSNHLIDNLRNGNSSFENLEKIYMREVDSGNGFCENNENCI